MKEMQEMSEKTKMMGSALGGLQKGLKTMNGP
jgi:hypothetical protein